MRDFPEVPQGLDKMEKKQRVVHYITEMPVIMNYYIMLTVNTICVLSSQESADNILSIVKQRTGSFGDRPTRPTLLEQVLNQKRLVSICL